MCHRGQPVHGGREDGEGPKITTSRVVEWRWKYNIQREKEGLWGGLQRIKSKRSILVLFFVEDQRLFLRGVFVEPILTQESLAFLSM